VGGGRRVTTQVRVIWIYVSFLILGLILGWELCSTRDSHAYVPHLIAAGLGTGFEERRDNEIRSNSFDRLLHRSLSLGQCWGERPMARETEGRSKGQGRECYFVNCLKFNTTYPSCMLCEYILLLSLFNIYIYIYIYCSSIYNIQLILNHCYADFVYKNFYFRRPYIISKSNLIIYK